MDFPSVLQYCTVPPFRSLRRIINGSIIALIRPTTTINAITLPIQSTHPVRGLVSSSSGVDLLP